MKIGCIAVIPMGYDRYLGIECAKGRGDILPGGKYEASIDLTFHDTAKREAKEEVGITCHNLEYLWHAPDGNSDFICFAFLATSFSGRIPLQTGEGKPKIVYRQALLESYFKAYYRILFEIIGNRYNGPMSMMNNITWEQPRERID